MTNHLPLPVETLHIDDDGLSALLRSTHSSIPQAASPSVSSEGFVPSEPTPANRYSIDPAIIQATRDFMQAALQQQPDLRWMVNPFSSARERYERFVALMREEIGRHRISGGSLATVSTEWDDLVALYASAIGWGPAQPYLDDPNVNEVKIVGHLIVVQERGRLPTIASVRFPNADDVIRRIRLLATLSGVTLDERTPQLTIPVMGGTRVHASIPPLVDQSVLVVIRRGRSHPWTLHDLLDHRALSPDTAELLRVLTRMRCSFLVAGATASGKTTLLEALANTWSSYAMASPHIVSIEDYARELVLAESHCWTAMRTNNAREYDRVLTEALRQTPDLVVAGEVRGVEAASVINLTLTGHAVMTTIHASDPLTALIRLATLASGPESLKYAHRFTDALRDATLGFDIIVMVRRDEITGQRYISDITVINGIDETGPHPHPILVPLLQTEIQEDRSIVWHVGAEVQNGTIVMRNNQPVPERLRRLLPRLAGSTRQHTAQLSREGVQRAITYAQSIATGQPETALHVLQQAWSEFRDPALIHEARLIIQRHPHRFAVHLDRARKGIATLQRHIAYRQWAEAHETYSQQIATDLIALTEQPPFEVDTWMDVLAMIRAGLERITHAQSAIAAATQSIAEGNTLAAHHVLNTIDESSLPIALRIALTETRIMLLERQHMTHALDSARQYRDQLRAIATQLSTELNV